MFFIVVVTALWLCAALRPVVFATLLFAAAPWMGLFVQYGYELDVYKLGLVLLPVLFLSCLVQGQKLRLVEMPWALVALVLYACLLTIWRLWSSEELTFQLGSDISFKTRMIASGTLFVLRVLTVVAVASICRTPQLRRRCVSVYLSSVLVLALFGIAQEITYVFSGTFLTYIMRDGIFGAFHETAGIVDVGGVSLMRIYSFSREPKDLALFCLPAIALLIAELSIGMRGRQRRFAGLELLAIMLAGILTFSSSFLILLPAVILVTWMLRPDLPVSISPLRWLRRMWALVLLLPLLIAATQGRVLGRFDSWGDLLQVSRERPALAFMADNTPRWFAGFGVGGQAFYLPPYMPDAYSAQAYQLGVAAGVDSFFLAVLLDLGLIGAIFLLATVVWLLKKTGNPAAFPYRAAFIAILLAGIPLQVDLRSGILWLFAGLLWATPSDHRDSTRGFRAMSRSLDSG